MLPWLIGLNYHLFFLSVYSSFNAGGRIYTLEILQNEQRLYALKG